VVPGFLENVSATSDNVRTSQDTVAVAICQLMAQNASESAVGGVECCSKVRWSSFSVAHRVISRLREGVQLHAFMISTQDAWCVLSLTPRPHHTTVRAPRYALCRRLLGPQFWSGHREEKICSLYRESIVLVVHYTDS